MAAVSRHVLSEYGESAWAMKTYSYGFFENTYAITKLAFQAVQTPAFCVHDKPSMGNDTPGVDDAGIKTFSASYEDWGSGGRVVHLRDRSVRIEDGAVYGMDDAQRCENHHGFAATNGRRGVRRGQRRVVPAGDSRNRHPAAHGDGPRHSGKRLGRYRVRGDVDCRRLGNQRRYGTGHTQHAVAVADDVGTNRRGRFRRLQRMAAELSVQPSWSSPPAKPVCQQRKSYRPHE